MARVGMRLRLRLGSKLPASAGRLADWLAMGPHFSYLADSRYMTLNSGDVERWADQLDPLDSSKDLIQTTSGDRPPHLTPQFPGGQAGVVPDGITDYLSTTRALGILAESGCTVYLLAGQLGDYGVFGSQELFSQISPTELRIFADVGAVKINVQGTWQSLSTPRASFTSSDWWWIRLRSDGSTLTAADSFGGTAPSHTVTPPPASTETRLYSGESLRAHYRHRWLLGYPRALSAAEMAAVESDLQAEVT